MRGIKVLHGSRERYLCTPYLSGCCCVSPLFPTSGQRKPVKRYDDKAHQPPPRPRPGTKNKEPHIVPSSPSTATSTPCISIQTNPPIPQSSIQSLSSHPNTHPSPPHPTTTTPDTPPRYPTHLNPSNAECTEPSPTYVSPHTLKPPQPLQQRIHTHRPARRLPVPRTLHLRLCTYATSRLALPSLEASKAGQVKRHVVGQGRGVRDLWMASFLPGAGWVEVLLRRERTRCWDAGVLQSLFDTEVRGVCFVRVGAG